MSAGVGTRLRSSSTRTRVTARAASAREATGGLSPDEDPELGKRLAAFTLRA